MNAEKIAEHMVAVPLVDRLRGKSFIPGVHYVSQAECWMREAADEIDTLRAELRLAYHLLVDLREHVESDGQFRPENGDDYRQNLYDGGQFIRRMRETGRNQ